jgi:hypothetical protein
MIVLQSGNFSYVKDNGHKNYGPSGTTAFLKLIEKSGYKVKVDTSRNPLIANTFIIPVSSKNEEAFNRFVNEFKAKTTIICFVIPQEDHRKIKPIQVQNQVNQSPIGELVPVKIKSSEWVPPALDEGKAVDLISTKADNTTIVKIESKKNIRLVKVLDATCISNQYIDQANNADIMLGLVAMAAKPGENVTFVTNFSSKDNEDSLLDKLGGPFQAGWNQLLLLILVIFITLSVRFGLAPESRAEQRGARELVDGLAWMTKRKKNARWALRAVFDRVLAELERRHRVGRDKIIQRPDLFLSMESAVILKDVEAATMEDISEQDAIRYAKLLKRLV